MDTQVQNEKVFSALENRKFKITDNVILCKIVRLKNC